jgi:hypothetical protein
MSGCCKLGGDGCIRCAAGCAMQLHSPQVRGVWSCASVSGCTTAMKWNVLSRSDAGGRGRRGCGRLAERRFVVAVVERHVARLEHVHVAAAEHAVLRERLLLSLASATDTYAPLAACKMKGTSAPAFATVICSRSCGSWAVQIEGHLGAAAVQSWVKPRGSSIRMHSS